MELLERLPERIRSLSSTGLRLTAKTVLVTCALVNSEIGTIQPIPKIARIVRAFEKESGTHILVHTDAAQAPLWLSCALDSLGADMLSLDAGKCYGPKGVGVLAKRHGVSLTPILHGGAQELGLRAGTENTALIVGCANAIVRAQEGYIARSEKILKLREYFIELLLRDIPDAVLNGSRTDRVVNNVNISLPKFDTEYAVIWLDAKGIAVSTKSACSTGGGGSAVVREMTNDASRASSTIRFSLGEETTKDEIERAVSVLLEFIKLYQ